MNQFGIHYAYWGNQWDVDLCQRIRLAADAGFDDLEITPPDYMISMDREQMNDLKHCASDYGIEMSFCIGFPASKDMSSPDAAVRQAGIDYSKRMIDACAYMGGRILSGILYSQWPCLYDHPITPAYKQECWARGVESVREVVSYAADAGMEYAIEMVNRFEQFIVNSADEGIQFVSEVGHPNTKLLLDVFHSNIEEDSIPEAIRKIGPLLAHMHISEANRRLPGSGSGIPWTEVARALKDIHYQGRIVLEPFVATGGPVGNDLRIWRDLEKDVSLESRQENLKRSLCFIKALMQ